MTPTIGRIVIFTNIIGGKAPAIIIGTNARLGDSELRSEDWVDLLVHERTVDNRVFGVPYSEEEAGGTWAWPARA